VPTTLCLLICFSAVSVATDLATGALRDLAVESSAGGEMVGQADNEFRPADAPGCVGAVPPDPAISVAKLDHRTSARAGEVAVRAKARRPIAHARRFVTNSLIVVPPDHDPTGLRSNRIWPPDPSSDLLKTCKPSAWFQADHQASGRMMVSQNKKTARR
jgi:hypothetical protein